MRARERPGASRHESWQELTGDGFVAESFGGPVAERELEVDGFASSFLGEHRDLDPALERRADRVFSDILGRHIERFAGHNAFAALVVTDHLGEVGCGGNRGSRGDLGWQEQSDGAVVLDQVGLGGSLDVFGGDGFESVSVDEVQSPVALRGPFGELYGELAGVVGGQFALSEEPGLAAFDFLVGDSIGDDLVDGIGEPIEYITRVVAGSHFGHQFDHAGIVKGVGVAFETGGSLGLNQRLVESSGG